MNCTKKYGRCVHHFVETWFRFRKRLLLLGWESYGKYGQKTLGTGGLLPQDLNLLWLRLNFNTTQHPTCLETTKTKWAWWPNISCCEQLFHMTLQLENQQAAPPIRCRAFDFPPKVWGHFAWYVPTWVNLGHLWNTSLLDPTVTSSQCYVATWLEDKMLACCY